MTLPAPFTALAMTAPSEPAFDPSAYVQQTLQLLRLEVPAAQLPTVICNFESIQAIAQPVLDFPLPDDLEAAPQFAP